MAFFIHDKLSNTYYNKKYVKYKYFRYCAVWRCGVSLCYQKRIKIMTTIKITYKPQSRVGQGMIAAESKMEADITQKEQVWLNYGDQLIANTWAMQILQHRFNEPCILLSASVEVK